MLSSILRRRANLSCRSGARKFLSSGGVIGQPSEVGEGCIGVSKVIGPCLMMPHYVVGEGPMVYKFLSIIWDKEVHFHNRGGKEEVELMQDERTKWAGSSHGWLALFNSGNMCLLNPTSGRRIPLPPYRGSPFLDKEESPFPLKVILSHSPDEEKEECKAVMILGSLDRAASCLPGRSSNWEPTGRWRDRKKIVRGDFVYSAARRSFLGSVRDTRELCRTEKVEVWDDTSMDLAYLVNAPQGDMSDPGFDWRTYLVSDEETGQLYMVRRYVVNRKTIDYRVYKINEDSVELLSTLGDLVMFVGNNHSIVVKASQYPELIPNSIYFSGVWFADDNQWVDLFEYTTKVYCLFFHQPVDKKQYPSWYSLTFPTEEEA
ncbi:hypothetical protein OROMI_010349 [Orobanche minor]